MINEMHHFFTDASRRLTVRLVSTTYSCMSLSLTIVSIISSPKRTQTSVSCLITPYL